MKETKDTLTWQRKLLPFMTSVIVIVGLFFFVTTVLQLYQLHSRIGQSPVLNLREGLGSLDTSAANISENTRLEYARWKTLSVLEGNALERRYHQANVLLMSRVWTKYLGFVTGMILALVGAVFVLGKLQEANTTLAADSNLWKFSLRSTSPGLVLAVLGTILMLTTIATNPEITVDDTSLYTATWFAPCSTEMQPSPTPYPSPLPFERQDGASNNK